MNKQDISTVATLNYTRMTLMEILVHFSSGPAIVYHVIKSEPRKIHLVAMNSLHPQISKYALPYRDNQVHCFIHNTGPVTIDLNYVIKLKVLTIV